MTSYTKHSRAVFRVRVGPETGLHCGAENITTTCSVVILIVHKSILNTRNSKPIRTCKGHDQHT